MSDVWQRIETVCLWLVIVGAGLLILTIVAYLVLLAWLAYS